jgi:hypothetical protein
MKPKHPRSVDDGGEPNLGPEFYMLRGISAAENDHLQRRADALERRMFRRRVENPAKLLAELRIALRQAGWIELRVEWFGTGSLLVTARIGARLSAKLGKNRSMSAKEWLFGDFVKAARQVGLKPGIEDIGVDLNGRRILGSVSAVPMADSSVVLDRMVKRWLEQRRAKAAPSRGAPQTAADHSHKR